MRLVAGLTLIVVLGILAAGAASAQGEWLEDPLTQWNLPGAAVPLATVSQSDYQNLDYCSAQLRPAETAEDREVESAGWNLTGPYEAGWGLTVVRGTVGFDGMCRPSGYQFFVFEHGLFAGSVSPEPMLARSTGAGSFTLSGEDRVSASFVRYATDDPLCCPSLPTVFVSFHIADTVLGPVLVAERSF